MSAKKPGIAITFAELRPLFGLPQTDERVMKLLDRAGKVSWGKPDGDRRYAIAKQAGFDLLAIRAPDAQRGSPMLVHTAFLFAEGQDGHRQFASPPHGLTFSTRAEILENMTTPERSWLIGKGKVPVSAKAVSHDRWLIDNLYISTHYNAALEVISIHASLPTETE